MPNMTPGRKKDLVDQFRFDENKFTIKTADYVQSIEDDLVLIESQVEGIMSSLNIASNGLLEEIRILKLEKNKIRSELGARKDAQINVDQNASKVWETLAIIMGIMIIGAEGPKGRDIDPKEDLKGWVRSQLNYINAAMKTMKIEF